ncbi:MAG: hypothetical protein AMXMBFR51_21090 [Ignavibacteriota bacterium]
MKSMNVEKILSVWIAAAIAWLTTLTNLEIIIKILVSLVALCYGIWRWIKDIRNEKRNK